ncbi:hypothetical protein Micbo1qcDRAFT_155031, partial [Microdochium bolleyi]
MRALLWLMPGPCWPAAEERRKWWAGPARHAMLACCSATIWAFWRGLAGLCGGSTRAEYACLLLCPFLFRFAGLCSGRLR